MLLKIRFYHFFSTSRIDYKNWAKTSELFSKPRPKILSKDNPEYRSYRKQIREEIGIDELLKFDDKRYVQGFDTCLKTEKVISFIDIPNTPNIMRFQPDASWFYEDFLLRYNNIPEKMIDLILTKLTREQEKKKNVVTKEVFEKAFQVLSEKLRKELPKGSKIDYEVEMERLNSMTDEEFMEKFGK